MCQDEDDGAKMCAELLAEDVTTDVGIDETQPDSEIDLGMVLSRVTSELGGLRLVWQHSDLIGHVRHALHVYSRVAPRWLARELPTVPGVTSYDLGELGEIIRITDVWFPWYGEPSRQAQRSRWSIAMDGKLRLEGRVAPAEDGKDRVRIKYTAPHTIAGLCDATETTLDGKAIDLVVLGATAYAVMQHTLAPETGIARGASSVLLDWAGQRLRAFASGLEDIACAPTHTQQRGQPEGIAFGSWSTAMGPDTITIS